MSSMQSQLGFVVAQKQQENKDGGQGMSFDVAVICVVFNEGRLLL